MPFRTEPCVAQGGAPRSSVTDEKRTYELTDSVAIWLMQRCMSAHNEAYVHSTSVVAKRQIALAKQAFDMLNDGLPPALRMTGL